MKKFKTKQTRGAGLTEYIIITALVAVGTLGVIMVNGDNIRGLFSAADNAVAGMEDTTPATRKADGPLDKNMKNFALNSKGNPDRAQTVKQSGLTAQQKQALFNALSNPDNPVHSDLKRASNFDPSRIAGSGGGRFIKASGSYMTPSPSRQYAELRQRQMEMEQILAMQKRGISNPEEWGRVYYTGDLGVAHVSHDPLITVEDYHSLADVFSGPDSVSYSMFTQVQPIYGDGGTSEIEVVAGRKIRMRVVENGTGTQYLHMGLRDGYQSSSALVSMQGEVVQNTSDDISNDQWLALVQKGLSLSQLHAADRPTVGSVIGKTILGTIITAAISFDLGCLLSAPAFGYWVGTDINKMVRHEDLLDQLPASFPQTIAQAAPNPGDLLDRVDARISEIAQRLSNLYQSGQVNTSDEPLLSERIVPLEDELAQRLLERIEPADMVDKWLLLRIHEADGTNDQRKFKEARDLNYDRSRRAIDMFYALHSFKQSRERLSNTADPDERANGVRSLNFNVEELLKSINAWSPDPNKTSAAQGSGQIRDRTQPVQGFQAIAI